MGETSRRRTGEFVRALTGLLMKNPDGLPARDAIRALEELVPPTDWERETFPSGGVRFEKIVRFATVDLVKANWLLKHKGVWTVTEVGRKAYEDFKDPEAFYTAPPRRAARGTTRTSPSNRPRSRPGLPSPRTSRRCTPTSSRSSSRLSFAPWATTSPGSRRRGRTGESTYWHGAIRSERGRPGSRSRSSGTRRTSGFRISDRSSRSSERTTSASS
mgnify:CR=1 FL=1